MGSLTIRNIDEDLKRKLQVRAARQGLSMEEDLRRALQDLVAEPEPERRSAAEAASIYDRLTALSRPPLPAFDQKAASDDLSDFLP